MVSKFVNMSRCWFVDGIVFGVVFDDLKIQDVEGERRRA